MLVENGADFEKFFAVYRCDGVGGDVAAEWLKGVVVFEEKCGGSSEKHFR